MPRILPGILPGVIAMAIIVVASNILVQYQLGNWLTWGDQLSHRASGHRHHEPVYGTQSRAASCWSVSRPGCCVRWSRRAGQDHVAASPSPRARLFRAQLMDIAVFNQLRKYNWWLPPWAASVIGSVLDTAVFFSIAFSAELVPFFPGDDVLWANERVALLGSGPVAPLRVSLAAADWLVKLAQAVLALVPFRISRWKFDGSSRAN